MQQSYFNQYTSGIPQTITPNAVNINIFSPAAYANAPQNAIPNVQNPYQTNVPYNQYMQPMQNNPYAQYGQPYNPIYPYNNYSVYNPNNGQGMPLYPPNYNNMIQPNNGMNYMMNPQNSTNNNKDEKTDKKEKEKSITPLTNDYVKNLENYLNSDNSKVRLIGAKELLERFKEDDSRKDNPSLVPLLNKALRDPSPSVRFLALTAMQLGYSVGNDETVQILKQIQQTKQDKYSEDGLMASEILLKLSAPEPIKKSKVGN